jgi:hypothetical protein
MFCRPDRVGAFAVDAAALAAGNGDALFGLLVTMTMFQRRSDLQIMRVLRGIPKTDARVMVSAPRLLALADAVPCEHISSVYSLKDDCDLAKHPETKRGVCHTHPDLDCYLKRHTELLKRYGHFGKVPTSAALMLRSHGVGSLAELRERAFAEHRAPSQRAVELEKAISRAWRVSQKIAAMFLSAVTNADLSGELAPWSEGVDSSHFVVIDSNVDLFLRSIGYDGPMTYSARRTFVQRLARRVPLGEMDGRLSRYNPRLVQQALYMFMSVSNRRVSPVDCVSSAPTSCASCPGPLASRCGLRAGTAG